MQRARATNDRPRPERAHGGSNSGRYGRAARSALSSGPFLLVPLLSAISAAIAIPTITRTYGLATLGDLLLGQTIGNAAAVLIELAWGLTGPQMISRLPVRARARRYAISVSSRLALWAVATPVAVAVTLGLVESNVLAAALMAVAGTTAGLSAAWFYIGLRRPWTLIFAEVAPRVVFTLLAIVLMHAGLPLLWYPSLLIAAAAAAPAIGWRVSGANRRDVRGWNPRRMWFVVRFQSNGLAARVLSSAYIALPLPIVAIVNPAAVPDFAAIERLQRLVLAAAAALPSLFQHWVGSSTSPSERDKRAKATVAAGVLFGGLTGVAYFFAAPWMAGLLFSGKLSIPDIGWALSAILIAIVIVSRMTGGIALVNARRIRAITWSAVAGAIAGPIAIATLAMHFGALGAVGGEIVAEAAVLIVQLIALMTIWYWPRTGGRRVRRGEGN